MDSLPVEVVESNLFACAGLPFRLKTAPIDGRGIADLGIMITGSDSAKFCSWGSTNQDFQAFMLVSEATKLQTHSSTAQL